MFDPTDEPKVEEDAGGETPEDSDTSSEDGGAGASAAA